ncbi:single-stranded-DNA-specific exonuclease RecJ [Phaeovibrio sulfidiphilus]|uniref:Single-stranded-DNA-specific exonuclease RecJ n=1 Tax=Phaeovibrio sulfidiphilus TaxID=1220600 RepID=A0A8J6YQ36_9PROT|nr:single-stranded-DNA-specific exonuclease RecJ [Phaeovibrio sulfidiphilus]MBE1237631.1 single-stranded-DNA-specific exonuclease RecJ [Phaeovibrio sulfidiphilus]
MTRHEPQTTSEAADGSVRRALLGVHSSKTGRIWCQRSGDERLALAISQRLGVPEIIGRILAGRSVPLEIAETYLDPTLRAALPDPSHLLDMDKAVERIVRAVRDREKVAVFGDYDVDGATASALMHRFLRALGLEVEVYIPDRQKEGYGPGIPAMLALASRGATLVITVDCGVSAFEPLAKAAEIGLDVIVCDHHEAQSGLPEACAVVNPKRLDETTDHTCLAAVGVAFLMAIGVNRALREANWYRDNGRDAPDLMSYLDLVALGTVCDMVPLVGVNRALVRQGLKVLAAGTNTGLQALMEVSKVRDIPGPFHLGFILGPRINAGGRVGEAGMGPALLACDDPVQALEMARHMEAWNSARKEIETEVLDQALEMAAAIPEDAPVIFVAGQGWHSGVVGIVASRLKERYFRPVCVVALEGGVGKGSGRSVKGIDLGRAVISASEAGLLEAGGGHAMAAGFTVMEPRLDAFRAFLEERILAQMAGAEDSGARVLEIDGVLDVRGACPDFTGQVERAGPYGVGNPEPVFAVANARVSRVDIVGMGHIRCFFSGAAGGSLKGMAFRSADSELGHALLNARGRTVHVAGILRPDTWGGRNGTQLLIEDLSWAD